MGSRRPKSNSLSGISKIKLKAHVLKSEWIEVQTKKNGPYYYKKGSTATTYNRPPQFEKRDAALADKRILGGKDGVSGWTAHTEQTTKRQYYTNRAKNLTTWQCPVRRLGKWYCGQFLGQGGFATVFLGAHSETGALCAVKIFDLREIQRRQRQTPEKMRTEVEKEVRLQMQVQGHKNVCNLQDYFSPRKEPHLLVACIDLASDGDLTKVVFASDGALSEERVRYIFRQLCAGLMHCHDAGVCHRDLKLDNALMEDDRVILSDFGLAAEQKAGQRLMQACGTLEYMAPEIMMDRLFRKEGEPRQGYDGYKSDCYSLGVLLFVLWAADFPFFSHSKSNRIRDMAHKVTRDRPTWSGAGQGSSRPFPKMLRALLEQLLVKDPLARPSLAEVMKHPWVTLGTTVITKAIIRLEEEKAGRPLPELVAARKKQQKDLFLAKQLEGEAREMLRNLQASTARQEGEEEKDLPPKQLARRHQALFEYEHHLEKLAEVKIRLPLVWREQFEREMPGEFRHDLQEAEAARAAKAKRYKMPTYVVTVEMIQDAREDGHFSKASKLAMERKQQLADRPRGTELVKQAMETRAQLEEIGRLTPRQKKAKKRRLDELASIWDKQLAALAGVMLRLPKEWKTELENHMGQELHKALNVAVQKYGIVAEEENVFRHAAAGSELFLEAISDDKTTDAKPRGFFRRLFSRGSSRKAKTHKMKGRKRYGARGRSNSAPPSTADLGM